MNVIQSYDRTRKVFRDAAGQVVTKHNPELAAAKIRRRVQALDIASGDIEGSHNLTISNRVYNSLNEFSKRSDHNRSRIHEQKDFSTNVMALDQKTRLLVFKLIANGVIDAIEGTISTGKEAVVLHGIRRADPEDPGCPVEHCAVKVFKTTITDFKGRAKFLTGDRRYDARVGKQHTRQLVKLWAEKEAANLARMAQSGMPCPTAFIQRKHIIVMSLIGVGNKPAEKLKFTELSLPALTTCYHQVCKLMKQLYTDCRLVHGDLSEYNILYHDSQPWIIDVGQSVETIHPRANEYLFDDCKHISSFFQKVHAI